MSRVPFLFIALLLLVSCSVRNTVTVPEQGGTTVRPKATSDVEIIHSISLDWSENIENDSLITPEMPFVDRWPLQYECYDGHFVMFVDSLSENVAELTLLSLTDWNKIMSANSDRPNEALDTATRYDEFGLDGWVIPSDSLARRMKSDLDIEAVNGKLGLMYGDDIQVTEGPSNARYLCNEATKSFSFAENTKISNAGAKTKYHLRLIHLQRVARLK